MAEWSKSDENVPEGEAVWVETVGYDFLGTPPIHLTLENCGMLYSAYLSISRARELAGQLSRLADEAEKKADQHPDS